MDYKSLAKNILDKVGSNNVVNVGHCVTRLRITCKSLDSVNIDEIESIDGVQGIVEKGNEIQVVIGTEVADVYREFIKLGDFGKDGKVDEEGKTSIVNRVIKYISGAIYPVLPVMTASALVGALCTILSNYCGLDTTSGTYIVLNTIYSALFDFLPIFVGFAAAKALGVNSYLGALLGALLVHGNINGVEGLSFLGITIPTMSYGSTIIPVLLGIAFMALVDHIIGKRIPQSISFFLRPLINIIITLPVTLIVLGPLGGFIGNYVALALTWLESVLGPFASAILGGIAPILVMTGMHTPLIPLGAQNFFAMGHTGFINPAMLASNIAIGGASLAVALKSKNSARKQSASTASLTAVLGISEPALFGVCIPMKKPLYGAMIGGAIGGFVAGLLGVKMFGLNAPGLGSLPLYINPDGTMTNLYFTLIAVAVSFIAGFVAVWLIGFEDDKIEE